ncbi:MAG TPA: amidohydrolase family protein [Candidatus Acidoferrales bacterium]|nr:amidohydrolase family protein [Candidatus Acidoferrales bacterium]
MYDLILKDARVVDGTGRPQYQADVGIEGDRIAAIGEISGPAREVIDAGGRVLSPGFVDVHTHYDAQITWDPGASPSPSLGVTTVVMGNCGFTIAPAPPPLRSLIARNLAVVEGMSLKALEHGIDWSFESIPEYLAMLRSKGFVPNVAVFAGHSTLRTAVMGEAASKRPANDEELAEMRALLSEALDAGAIGLASTQSHSHFGDGGAPMPSRLADEREFRTLIGTLGEIGRGVFMITGGPGTSGEFLEEMAATTRRPIIWAAALHSTADPERCYGLLRRCAEATDRGHSMYAQVSCQPLTMEFTLCNAYPFGSYDLWAELRGGKPDVVRRKVTDPEFRNALRNAFAQRQRGKLFYGDWKRVWISAVGETRNNALEGFTIAEVAERQRKDPLDVFFDLALDENLATMYSAHVLNYDEDAVEKLLKDDVSIIALSDAGAHLTFLCDAGYGLHMLGHWVRERKSFTLEDAIRRITSWPAEIYGIRDRGRIAVGAHADMLLFDPDTVGVSRPRRAHDLPGGDSRLIRDGVGVAGVWVNGTRVVTDNVPVHNGHRPGRLLDNCAMRAAT